LITLNTGLSNRDVSLLEVSARDKSNFEASTFNFTSEFYLSTTYKVNRPVPELYISFLIVNENGINVMFACNYDYTTPRKPEPLAIGTYTTRVLILPHFLFIGKYFVDIKTEIDGVGIESISSCVSFEITPEDTVNYDWELHPITYPSLKWTTECVAK
jgi:hypothetical protein